MAGSTKLLGRAPDLSDFVKNGKERASIEIELQGPKSRNYTILRRFNVGSTKACTWKLNGVTAKEKEISDLVAKLNIQVDNLW